MNNDLDTILAAYSDASSRPEEPRLKEWVRRYPQYERQLTEYAIFDYVCERGAPYATIGAEEEASALVRAKRIGAQWLTTQKPPLVNLLEAAMERGLSTPALANALNLSPLEVIKLNQRLFRAASLPTSLVRRLAELLDRTVHETTTYLRLAPTLAAHVRYRADRAPQVGEPEEFATSIAGSRTLSDAQKAHWQTEAADLLGDREL